MPAHATNPRARRLARGGGFTLVETMAVVVVMAIIAVVAIPSLSSLDDTRETLAKKQLLRDLMFARQYAIATGIITWVEFDEAGESYTVLAEDPDNPGKGNATALTDPATGQTYTQTFNVGDFIGVLITSATFDAGDDVGFDWLGRPLNDTGAELSAAWGTVTITGGGVNVSKMTGAFLET